MARVLVVDDSATMRKIIIKGLREAGFADLEVTEAADGASALGALRGASSTSSCATSTCPAWTVSRWCAACATTRSAGADLPIVMITTEGGLERVEEALAAGANDYLRKPFSAAQLQEKITPFVR